MRVSVESELWMVTPIWPYRIEKNEMPIVVGFSNPNLIHQAQLRKIATKVFQFGCDRSGIDVPLVALKHHDSLVGFRGYKLRELFLQCGSNG